MKEIKNHEHSTLELNHEALTKKQEHFQKVKEAKDASLVIDEWKQRATERQVQNLRQVAIWVPLTQEADVTPQLHGCDRSALSSLLLLLTHCHCF